ncbi:hypothetical protein OIU85_010858 [Salix viminalis]|uniref:Uncharacterized protein n=1 Tax=Salix viminalis TaxID=40686 RepID=A0A9Q0NRJ8_SALVM|nr:hypothetical protein OIU85_010858 [Salix viminalis]
MVVTFPAVFLPGDSQTVESPPILSLRLWGSGQQFQPTWTQHITCQIFAVGVTFASAATGYDNETSSVLSVIPLWEQMLFYKGLSEETEGLSWTK